MGDRISLIVQTASAILVSFGVGFSLSWKLALVVMSIQPIIIISLYTKKILLTGFAKHTAKAQHEGAQVASEAVAQHRTVTAFSSQDKVFQSPPSIVHFWCQSGLTSNSMRVDS